MMNNSFQILPLIDQNNNLHNVENKFWNWTLNSRKSETGEEGLIEFEVRREVLRLQNHFQVMRNKIPQSISSIKRESKSNFTQPFLQALSRTIVGEEKKEEKMLRNWKRESEILPCHDQLK